MQSPDVMVQVEHCALPMIRQVHVATHCLKDLPNHKIGGHESHHPDGRKALQAWRHLADAFMR
jgi:hypothetical protein